MEEIIDKNDLINISEKIIIYYSKLDKFVRIKNKELKLKYEKEKISNY